MLDSLVGFLLIITPLVFFHELGHFLFARLSGVRVLTFSVGFGRELLGYTDSKGTRWRLSLVPFGGYVKLAGESAADSEDADTPESQGNLHSASLFQRVTIVVAGPIVNVILGIVLIAFVNFHYGVYTQKNYLESGIASVSTGSAADLIGIQTGDVITSLNNDPIQDFLDIVNFMRDADGTQIFISYQRLDTIYQDVITPQIHTSETGVSRYVLGVTAPEFEREKMGIIDGFIAATRQAYWLLTQITRTLGGLFIGALDFREIGGPIKIAQYSGESLTAGPEQFFLFAAMLSLNLALINMFPIPGLDGGHLILYAIEGILRRPPPPKLVNFLNYIGVIFVLGLILVITVKDVFELFV